MVKLNNIYIQKSDLNLKNIMILNFKLSKIGLGYLGIACENFIKIFRILSI